MKFVDLPKEIQDKMLENQVLDGNARDRSVFERLFADSYYGFEWLSSIEGHDFWSRIYGGDVDHFYTVYPKSCIKPEFESLYKKTFRCNKIIESEIDPEKIRELGLEYILV